MGPGWKIEVADEGQLTYKEITRYHDATPL